MATRFNKYPKVTLPDEFSPDFNIRTCTRCNKERHVLERLSNYSTPAHTEYRLTFMADSNVCIKCSNEDTGLDIVMDMNPTVVYFN